MIIWVSDLIIRCPFYFLFLISYFLSFTFYLLFLTHMLNFYSRFFVTVVTPFPLLGYLAEYP